MQNSKPVINRNTRSKLHRAWRLFVEYALITFVFSSVVAALACTAYILGQFEYRQSVLILNREGCTHLQQLGITGSSGIINHLTGDAGVEVEQVEGTQVPSGALLIGTNSSGAAQSFLDGLTRTACSAANACGSCAP